MSLKAGSSVSLLYDIDSHLSIKLNFPTDNFNGHFVEQIQTDQIEFMKQNCNKNDYINLPSDFR